MIRESLYFSFDDVISDEEFNIINISVSTGLFSEPFLASRSINEVSVPGNDKPYFFGVNRDPKSITLGFYPQEDWDEEYLNAIARWLDVDEYKPLIFSSMPDKVMYAMPVDASEALHNGCREGYITLTMRLDSPYSYSHEKVDGWYDFSETGEGIIEFNNRGDKAIQPDIYIWKVGDGDVTIANAYEDYPPLTLTGLVDEEEIHIDPYLKLVKTNLPNVSRYNNFNDEYITLPYGQTHLQVTGKCMVKLQYQYKFAI